jgi:hypothetical protein
VGSATQAAISESHYSVLRGERIPRGLDVLAQVAERRNLETPACFSTLVGGWGRSGSIARVGTQMAQQR